MPQSRPQPHELQLPQLLRSEAFALVQQVAGEWFAQAAAHRDSFVPTTP
ncbi:hypothetical protein [Streptomyces scabiei]|nr:hypothetical protein [Streptomyces sp. LBUM 1481]